MERMAEVHVPQLDEHDEHDAAPLPAAARPSRTPSIVKIALEVVLIGTGVFLGLAGEQWRESMRHRELADASLHRFRTEILANRKAVAAVKEYHATLRTSIDAYLATAPASRRREDIRVNGVQPVFFERTAWDLAMATQSLNDIDSQLAFAIARVYNSQQTYTDITHGILQAMYLRPPNEDLDAFLSALALYLGDIVLNEPRLLTMYDALLPQIDRAVGDSVDEKAAPR
jgi:hypothetical protein